MEEGPFARMSQSWKWLFPALNEVESWGQGALWEALGKCQAPIDLVPTVVQGRSSPRAGMTAAGTAQPSAGSWVHCPYLQEELKYFYLQEDLSEDLEPEEGHWVVQHSWLGCECSWAGV